MVNYGWNKQSRPRSLALAIWTLCFPPETPRNIAFIPLIPKALKAKAVNPTARGEKCETSLECLILVGRTKKKDWL